MSATRASSPAELGQFPRTRLVREGRTTRVVTHPEATDEDKVPEALTPPPPSPKLIAASRLESVVGFVGRSRETIKVVYRKNRRYITDGDSFALVPDAYWDKKVQEWLTEAAQARELPGWVHHASCGAMEDANFFCCCEPVEDNGPKYEIDTDWPVMHHRGGRYYMSKEGVLVDHKRQAIGARKEAELKMEAMYAYAADIATQTRAAAMALARAAEEKVETGTVSDSRLMEATGHIDRTADATVALALAAHRHRCVERATPAPNQTPPPVPADEPQAFMQAPLPAEPAPLRPPDAQAEDLLLNVPIAQAMFNPDICAICQEVMALGGTFTLDCMHRFHVMCLGRWIVANHDHPRGNQTCPLCRAAFDQHTNANIRAMAGFGGQFDDGRPVFRPPAAILPRPNVVAPGVGGDGQPPNDPPQVLPPLQGMPAAVVAAPRDNGPIALRYWVSAPTVIRAQRSGVVVRAGTAPHPHPQLATDRRVLLDIMDREYGAAGFVIAAKGQYCRYRAYRLSTNAYCTNLVANNLADFNACGCACTPEVCTHVANHTPILVARPDVPLETVASYARRGRGDFIIADLEVRGARTVVYPPDLNEDQMEQLNRYQTPEGMLSVRSSGLVELRLNGDPHTYTYPFPEYQHRPIVKVGGQNYVVERTHTVGQYGVWHFTPTMQAAIESVAIPLDDALQDAQYLGPVAVRPRDDGPGPLDQPVGMNAVFAYSVLDDVCTRSGEIEAYVPKTAIIECMHYMAGKPRNEFTLSGLNIFITEILSRFQMTSQDAYGSKLFLTNYCYTAGLPVEQSLHNRYISSAMSAIKRYNSALDFTVPSLTQVVLGPLFDRVSQRSRARLARAGDFILHRPMEALTVASLMCLALVTFIVMARDPPPTMPLTVSERVRGMFGQFTETIHHYGSEAYAMTFPECQSKFLRQLDLEPPCRVKELETWQLVKPWSHAAYYRILASLSAVWLGLLVIGLEELVKRLRWGKYDGFWLVCALEYLQRIGNGISGIWAGTVVCVVHWFTGGTSFHQAVWMHIMWNSTVFCMGLNPMYMARLCCCNAVMAAGALAAVKCYQHFQRLFPWWTKGAPGLVFGPRFRAKRVMGAIDKKAWIRRATCPKDDSSPAFRQMGPLFCNVPNVPAISSENLYRAVRTRHLMPKEHVANVRTLKRLLAKVAQWMHAPDEVRHGHHPQGRSFGIASFKQWFAHLRPGQRNLVKSGHERVQRDGYKAKWSRGHAVFVKVEKHMKNGADFAPRLILTVTPMFSAVVGPYLWSLSKWCKDNFMNPFYYCAGKSLEAVSNIAQSWELMRYYPLGLDQSKCDASYHTWYLKATAAYYLRCFIPPRVFNAILAAYKRCKMYGRDGLRAMVMGTLVTGSNETTIGNTLKVGMAVLGAWLLQFPEEQWDAQLWEMFGPTPPFVFMQVGDDTFLMVRPDVTFPVENMRQFGFRPKRTDRGWANADFLSSIFWPCLSPKASSLPIRGVPGGINMNLSRKLGPKPGRQIVKFGADIQMEAGVDPAAKARSVALGMIDDAYHVPVLGPFLRRVLDLTEHVGPVKPFREEHKLSSEGRVYCDERTYALAAERYNLSVADIKMCEDRLTNLELFSIVADPVIDRMVQVDLQ